MTTMNLELITSHVMKQLKNREIPIGISNRHVHLCEKDFAVLFPGQTLKVLKPLHQPGHFAAEQTLSLVGPKGRIDNVRILGPLRKATQLELSCTNARELGVKAQVRHSGDLEQTPGITLLSEFGQVTLTEGAIIAKRHIHMSPVDAVLFSLKDGQEVSVKTGRPGRELVLSDVTVRVNPCSVLELHLDTDEANAAGLIGKDDSAQLVISETARC